jgi:hypothetical protein
VARASSEGDINGHTAGASGPVMCVKLDDTSRDVLVGDFMLAVVYV